MTHRSHFLLLVLSCANISLNAMDKTNQQENPLPPYVRTIEFAGFRPTFDFEPKPVSSFGEEVGNELFNLIKEIKITQNTAVKRNPRSGNEEYQSAPSQIELRHIEKCIATAALNAQKVEITKAIEKAKADLTASASTIVEKTKAEEAAKLSIFQRNSKKTILCALAIGAVTPFVLPELLKKAGL